MAVRARLIEDRDEWLEWRKENINASEIAALFGEGVHPFVSAYQLFALKCEMIEPERETRAMKRGRLFEPVLLDALQEQHPDWIIRKTRHYFDDSELRLGATPDFDADRPDQGDTGVIQGKIVSVQAFRSYWRNHDTGDPQVPPYVALQASQEAYLSGAAWAGVAALVDIDVHYFDLPYVAELIPKFGELSKDFWRRVQERDPYPIDWGRDAEAVLEAYREKSDASVLDLEGETYFEFVVKQRENLMRVEREGDLARKQRRPLDAQITMRMGNHKKARCSQGLVNIKTIRKKAYSVAATVYSQIEVKP
jgi:predicted phage-related endonuclease